MSNETQPSEGWPGQTDRADIGHNDTLVADPVATVTADPRRTQPDPPPPRRWWVPALLGVVLVAGATAAAALTFSIGPDAPDVGVDVARLPTATTLVVSGRPRSELWGEHVIGRGDLASWWAARMCSGSDIAAALRLSAGADLASLEAAGLNALAKPAELKKAMACGMELADALGEARVTEIAYEQGSSPQRVIAVPDWKSSFPKPPLGALSGTTWYAGHDAALDGLSKGDTGKGAVQELFEEVAPASATLLASRPTTIDLTLPCQLASPHEARAAFVRACFPRRFAKQNESLAVKLRGVAIMRDVPAETGRVRLELIVLGKDAAATDIVHTALRAFWAEMLSMVNDNEVALSKLAKEDPVKTVLFDPWLRALRNTTIVRDGQRIRLLAETTLDEGEKARLSEAAKSPAPFAEEIDAIIEALTRGEAPPIESVSTIVGADNAIWLTSPMATEQDCAAIVAHAESLPVSEEQFGKRFEIQKTWAKASCKHLLPEATRQCLLGAKDIVAMSQCEVPARPEAKP